jgi:nitrate/TMAO reductase-like tetraheme cytochrome c subunit
VSSPPRTKNGGDPGLWRWEVVGLLALVTIVVTIPLSLRQTPDATPASIQDAEAIFVGTASCRDCHQVEYNRWLGSDHDKAMDVATDDTVRADFNDTEFTYRGVTSRFYRRDGKFFVHTEGPGGEMAEFEVTHVFGHEPLQQYLVPFPGGRLQALSVTWDTENQRWYRQYPDTDIPPDDWLHWSRGAQNWNAMCAECHSTNLQKNYDPATDTYDTTWSDIDVGCEACHGPGSRHVAWAEIAPMARPSLANYGLVVNTSNLAPQRLVEHCAPCHARRAELGDYDHTGTESLDYMLPSLLREGLYHADGQILDEVYVYGSFLQSKMYARGVTCRDCHDSHSLKLHRAGNELCLQCHEREVYDTYDHHFHQQIARGPAVRRGPVRQVPHGRAAVHGDRLARRPQLSRAAAGPVRGTRHPERMHRLSHRPDARMGDRRLPPLVRRGAQAALRHDVREIARRRARRAAGACSTGCQRTSGAHRPRDRHRTAGSTAPLD